MLIRCLFSLRLDIGKIIHQMYKVEVNISIKFQNFFFSSKTASFQVDINDYLIIKKAKSV